MTIPGFTSTGSKRPDALFGDESGVPRRFLRAEGCRVWDERGKEYYDLVMALGAVGLGYGHDPVTAAVDQATREGVVGPLPHVLECEVADKLASLIPGAESIRFLKTGAEAVAAALRIARVQTGRDRVITCGYHGWLDWCSDSAGVPQGICELRREVPFNDVQALRHAVDDVGPVAAIVVEPVVESEPTAEWLSVARDLATRAGAVLVFDEIKTAFRIAKGGAAEAYGVTPDISVVGKALGNGFPIAAVCGSKGVMEAATQTWISSTLATEHVSLAAANAVIGVYGAADVVGHLRSLGEILMDGLRSVAERFGEDRAILKGIPQMCYLDFVDEAQSAEFAAAAAELGVIFKRSAYNFVSYSHTDGVAREILSRLERAAEQVMSKC